MNKSYYKKIFKMMKIVQELIKDNLMMSSLY